MIGQGGRPPNKHRMLEKSWSTWGHGTQDKSILIVVEAQKRAWVEHRGKKKIITVKLQYTDKDGKKMEEEECKKSGEVGKDEIGKDVMHLLRGMRL